MKKELDLFRVWGTDTAIYIIQDENKVYGQYGGIGSGYAKLYGLDLVRELARIKVDKNQFWFESDEEVIEYLKEIKEGNNE